MRSKMRKSKLNRLHRETSWARSYKTALHPELKGSVTVIEEGTEALLATQRAQALKDEALRAAKLLDRETFARAARRRSFAKTDDQLVKLRGIREETPPRQPEEPSSERQWQCCKSGSSTKRWRARCVMLCWAWRRWAF
ncbi:unnamed protein product [Effrenium voratum]|nr:unnamed protein product [Effrenium voratum]